MEDYKFTERIELAYLSMFMLVMMVALIGLGWAKAERQQMYLQDERVEQEQYFYNGDEEFVEAEV